MSYKTGELIRWMMPLDNDYSYGYILGIRRSIATIKCTGYYSKKTVEVHLKYIEKHRGGGGYRWEQ